MGSACQTCLCICLVRGGNSTLLLKRRRQRNEDAQERNAQFVVGFGQLPHQRPKIAATLPSNGRNHCGSNICMAPPLIQFGHSVFSFAPGRIFNLRARHSLSLSLASTGSCKADELRKVQSRDRHPTALWLICFSENSQGQHLSRQAVL